MDAIEECVDILASNLYRGGKIKDKAESAWIIQEAHIARGISFLVQLYSCTSKDTYRLPLETFGLTIVSLMQLSSLLVQTLPVTQSGIFVQRRQSMKRPQYRGIKIMLI